MSAKVEVRLLVISAPMTLTKPTGEPCAFVQARELDDDHVRWQLFGMAPPEREALTRLQPGDLILARGPLAARVDAGAVVLAINVMQLVLQNSSSPATPPATTCSTRGTKMATRAGVEAADREWRERNLGGLSV